MNENNTTAENRYILFIVLKKVGSTHEKDFLYLFKLIVLNYHERNSLLPYQLRITAQGIVSFY